MPSKSPAQAKRFREAVATIAQWSYPPAEVIGGGTAPANTDITYIPVTEPGVLKRGTPSKEQLDWLVDKYDSVRAQRILLTIGIGPDRYLTGGPYLVAVTKPLRDLQPAQDRVVVLDLSKTRDLVPSAVTAFGTNVTDPGGRTMRDLTVSFNQSFFYIARATDNTFGGVKKVFTLLKLVAKGPVEG